MTARGEPKESRSAAGAVHRYGDGIVRSAGIIAGLTFLSRLLGVARDMACAALFGAGMVWDAFSFAFRVPNLFRRLFGEGALSAAFVPAVSQCLEQDGLREAGRMAGLVGGALIVVLSALVALGELVIAAIAVAAGPGPRWGLALLLTAVLLPYALLICLTAFLSATLHALRRFAAPALAPALLNVCWIAAVLLVAPVISPAPRMRILVVALAVVTAGVLQVALQLTALRRAGFRWRPLFQLLDPYVRRVAVSMVPVALGLAAFQLNVLLDGVIAISLAGPEGEVGLRLGGMALPYPMRVGANSVLYYANRLMQMPLGVFGVALATAVFPALSRQAAGRDWKGFSASVTRGLRLVMFIGIPAGVGLILLRRQAVSLLFERGAFTAGMTSRTAFVLVFYSAGLWAYCALHLLVRAFYGLQRPGVPARLAAAMVGLNLALNLVLVWPLREAGLALATAVCAALQVVVLLDKLRRTVPLEGLAPLGVTLGKTCCAAAAMAVVAWGALQLLSGQPPSLATRLVRVLVPAGAGFLTYVLAAGVLRAEELHMVLRALRRGRER